MDLPETLRRMHQLNEWWDLKKVPDKLLKPFRRRDFYKILDSITPHKTTVLIGPRRVGKTTLIYQLIEHLINDDKVDPSQILYLRMDDFLLKSAVGGEFHNVFKVYSQSVLKSTFREFKNPIYIFLDEIQAWPDWSQSLKDMMEPKYNITFLVSGSSSPAIFRKAAEAMTGRYRIQLMLPMKYIDVVNKKLGKGKELTELDKLNLMLRDALKQAISNKDISIFYRALNSAFNALVSKEDKLKIILNEYLIKGGYPELYDVETENWYSWSESLRNQLGAIITKDIVSVFNLKSPEKILDLFQLISSQTAQIRAYEILCARTGIVKVDTLKDYLSALKETYLIGVAEIYSKNVDTSKKSKKKLYTMDVGLRNVALGVLDPSLLQNSNELGKVAETVVYDHCMRLKYNLDATLTDMPIFYWRSNGDEVDIILPTKPYPIPIEVTYKSDHSESGLRKFMEKFDSPFGIVVSRGKLAINNNIIHVPMWLFLLMC